MTNVRFSTWKLEARKDNCTQQENGSHRATWREGAFFSKTAEELIQQIFKEDLSDKSILKPAKMTNQIGVKNT